MLLLLLACAAAPEASDTTLTDGGTWQLRIGSLSYDQGAQDLDLFVSRPDEAQGIPGLLLTVTLGMSGMEHDAQPETLDDAGDGHYGGTVVFTMSGVWSLEGQVDDGERAEAFQMNVQATP